MLGFCKTGKCAFFYIKLQLSKNAKFVNICAKLTMYAKVFWNKNSSFCYFQGWNVKKQETFKFSHYPCENEKNCFFQFFLNEMEARSTRWFQFYNKFACERAVDLLYSKVPFLGIIRLIFVFSQLFSYWNKNLKKNDKKNDKKKQKMKNTN